MQARERGEPFESSHGRVTVLAVLVLGAVLRCASLTPGLFFDEMWTIQNVADAGSFWSAVGRAHDNNHPLISAWIWGIGVHAPASALRMLSVILAIASVCLVANGVGRKYFPGGVPFLFLFAFSYPLTVFAGQMRGYSCAIFFLISVWWMLARLVARKVSSPCLLDVLFVGLSSALATLSHATAVIPLIGLMLWFGMRELASGRAFYSSMVLPIVGIFAALPGVLVALGGEIGGGTRRSVWDVLIETLSVFGGGPTLGGAYVGWELGAVLYAATVLVLCLRALAGLSIAAKVGVSVGALGIVVVLLQSGERTVSARYLVVILPWVLLGLSLGFSTLVKEISDRSSAKAGFFFKLIGASVFVAFSFYSHLLLFERGSPESTLPLMTGSVVTNQPFRLNLIARARQFENVTATDLVNIGQSSAVVLITGPEGNLEELKKQSLPGSFRLVFQAKAPPLTGLSIAVAQR